MATCLCGASFVSNRGARSLCEDCRARNQIIRGRIHRARAAGITDIEAFLVQQQAKADDLEERRALKKQQYADHLAKQGLS